MSDLSFIDVGCGSGLHSLAASRLNAKSIFSFDFDPHAVAISRRLRQRGSFKNQWQIEQGSILDDNSFRNLVIMILFIPGAYSIIQAQFGKQFQIPVG